MATFTDGLIIAQATPEGVQTFAAKLKFDGDEDGQWVNSGFRTEDGTIHVGNAETHHVVFAFDAEGLAKYKARRAAEDENAHHQIVGRGFVDGAAVVGFAATGGRIGLKPAAGVAVPISELE